MGQTEGERNVWDGVRPRREGCARDQRTSGCRNIEKPVKVFRSEDA